MRYSIIMLLMLALVSTAVAQDDQSFNDGELEMISQDLGRDFLLESRTRNIKGDPYLNEDFLPGVIRINEGLKTGELLVRYNTEKNIVEFKKGDGYYGLNPARIHGFTIYGTPNNIVFKNGFQSEDHDISRATLLRMIYDGKTKLVAHHTTSLQKDIATYGSGVQQDEYIDDVDFYIITPSGEFRETKLRRKDILRDLDRNLRDKVESYAENQGLDFEKEADLAKILKHYDQLKAQGG